VFARARALDVARHFGVFATFWRVRTRALDIAHALDIQYTTSNLN
jgi:hypothetical protein